MIHTLKARALKFGYYLVLASLVMGSFLFPVNKAKADLTTGPGELTLGSVTVNGASSKFSGSAVGGDGFDDDCPFPPTSNHSFHAYTLSQFKYKIDGGATQNFSATTTQTGVGHNTCQAGPDGDKTYQYSFNNITFDASGLSSGTHTLTALALDSATGFNVQDTYSFEVGCSGNNCSYAPSIAPTCSADQSVVQGSSATFTISMQRNENPVSPDPFSVTTLAVSSSLPSGVSPDFNPDPVISIPSGQTGTTTLTISTQNSSPTGPISIQVAINNVYATICNLTINSSINGGNGTGGTLGANIYANNVGGTVTVTPNTTAALTWDCPNGASYKVLGQSVNSTGNGSSGSATSASVPAGTSYTYNLTCYDQANQTGNTKPDSVTVTASNPPPGFSAKIEVSKDSSSYGSSITIAPDSTGYVRVTKFGFSNSDCSVAPTGWNGSSSTHTVTHITTDVTYTLTCSVGGNTIISSADIHVISADLKIAGLDGPANLDAGNYLVTWSSLHAKACRIQPVIPSIGSGWVAGTQSQGGQPKYVDIAGNITYTLACSENVGGSGAIATDTVTININSPDFSLICNTLSKSVTAGGAVLYDVTATKLSGFSGNVTVSITAGLPADASSSPVTITPTGVGQVPVTTQVTTPVGTYTLTFTGTGSGITHTCQSGLTVSNAAGTKELDHIDLTPEQATIALDDTQDYEVLAWFTDGSKDDVTSDPATAYTSSIPSIAYMKNNTALGIADGVTNIGATYNLDGVIKADTAVLTVGSGSISASLTCPSGQDTCSVGYNGAINLTWSSTNALSCSVAPALTPAASGTSGTSSTGPLTGTTAFTLTCYRNADLTGESASDLATVSVSAAQASFVTSDKDIVGINGSGVTASPCSGATDSVGNTTFKAGDRISFRINLCNTGAEDASSIVLTDQLTNLTQPTAGWNAKWNGANISPTVSGSAPNQILTFSIPGTIKYQPQNPWSGYLTFDAQVTAPSSQSNTLYRFQNYATIASNGLSWAINTPLYLFYSGSKVPQKYEVAP